MFAAADVHYPPCGGARAALVLASDATFSTIVAEKTAFIEHVAPYQPGEFYRRELPPLRALLTAVDALDLLIIDGYATLDPDGRPGLGAYAHDEFAVPVIGVAKTRFVSAVHAIPVFARERDEAAVRDVGRRSVGRRGRAGPSDGREVPPSRRTAPG